MTVSRTPVTLAPVLPIVATTTLTIPGRFPDGGLPQFNAALLPGEPFEDEKIRLMAGTVRSSSAAIAVGSEEMVKLLVTDPGVALVRSDSAPPMVPLATALCRLFVGATCAKSELPAAANPATTQLLASTVV
jgi:hypothetical protein